MTTPAGPAGTTRVVSGRISTESAKSEKPSHQIKPGEKYSAFKAFFMPGYRRAWEQYKAQLQAKVARIEAEKSEEEAEAARILAEKIQTLHNYNEALGNLIRRRSNMNLTAGVANVKGGVGKTPIACNIAATLSTDGKRLTILNDMNSMSGTSPRRLGLADAVQFTVNDLVLAEEKDQLKHASGFTNKLPVSDDGVLLVSSDKVVQHQDQYSEETTRRAIEVSSRHGQFVIVDTGNNIGGSGMVGILKSCDALIIAVNTTIDGINNAVITMRNFDAWGYGDLVRASAVVVVGLREGQRIEDYRERLELNEHHMLFAVPHDEGEVIGNPIHLETADFYLRLAYREVTAALMVVGPLDKSDTKAVQHAISHARTGHIVTLPDGTTPVLPWIDGSPRLIESKE